MDGLLDLINSDMGRQIISGVSQQSGASQNQTSDVLSMALPVLMGAMRKNASTPQGAQGLLGALSDNKHSGSILDNLGDLFQGGVDQSVMDDGAGILGHVLGGRQQNVENALSQKSGVDASTVSQIIKIAAPILMGYLGKQQRSQGVSDTNGLGSLLEGVMGAQQSSRQNQSLIEQLIDADGDGSIIDDIAGMAMGTQKKRGGLGGLLGGLFRKR